MGVARSTRTRKPVLRPGFEVEAVSPRTRPSVVRAANLARALDAAASVGRSDDGDREEKEARLPVTAKRVAYSRDNWSAWEDQQLRQLVQKFGGKKWAKVADGIPGRKGKQCRERWHNHLNPAVDKSSWTRAEDIVIHAGVYELGHKWAAIARGVGASKTSEWESCGALEERRCIRALSTPAVSESMPACISGVSKSMPDGPASS